MDPARTTQLSKALVRAGFLVLGGFHPKPEDDAPPLHDGQGAATLLLIGSAGPALFQAFRTSSEHGDGAPDPLDRYTRRILSQIADAAGVEPVFVFDGPPYYPFQRYAARVGGFSSSPMGLLAHHRYGPWAALRAAFLSSETLGGVDGPMRDGPCPTCVDKACVAACPAGALSVATGYDVPRCREYLADVGEKADCLTGCLARRACPIGQDVAHDAGQGAFHMAAFNTMPS